MKRLAILIPQNIFKKGNDFPQFLLGEVSLSFYLSGISRALGSLGGDLPRSWAKKLRGKVEVYQTFRSFRPVFSARKRTKVNRLKGNIRSAFRKLN